MKKQLLLFVTMLLAVVMPMKLWAADGNPEPYAVLSDNNTKLTFFYDDQKDARGGMGVGPFLPDSERWGGHQGEIVTVVFDTSFANCTTLTSTASWFAGCGKLTSISDISNLKTDNVTDMCYMFSGCSSLTSLNVSGFKTDNVTDMNSMFNGCSSLTMLDVGGLNTANVTDMYGMFGGCSTLTSLDLSNFKTDNITSMNRMFDGCSSLTSLDVSNFNTANVTYMGYMFWGCSSLTSLDVRNFKTDKVTEMIHMFSGCSNLTMLDIASFNTENVASMFYMFNDCSNLKSIYAGDGWSTAKVENGNGMFNNCTNLVGGAGTVYDANHTDHTYAHIDGGTSNPGYFTDKNAPVATVEPYAVLSDNNTKLTFFYDDQKDVRGGLSVGPFKYPDYQSWYGVRESITTAIFDDSFANCTTLTSTAYWFKDCNKLTTISNIGNLNTINVMYMGSMFENCSNLVSLDVSGFKTDNVLYMDSMFDGCSNLVNLDVSGFKTDNVTSMGGVFKDCSSLTSLEVGGFKTDNVTYMSLMFYGCSGLTSLDLSRFNTDKVTNMDGMFYGCSGLTSLDVSGFKTENVTDMGWMFSGCSGLTSLDVSGFKTDKVTRMSGMFYGCSGLTSLDVSGFNTENVTDMSSMFERCFSLTSLDLNNFNTENVTNMHSMFDSCSRLASLNVSSFKTANVTDMGLMFSACYELTNLDVSHFNTDNVTDMHGMFGGSSGLTSLDLSNFKTDKVTTMFLMFEGCLGLTSLDLSSFNTENVTKFTNMFKECSNLKTIYVGSGWSTANVAEGTSMFYGCTNLVGGAGTAYDENHVDHTYAHIDGGTSNPGYFTAKNAPEGEATFDGKVARVSGERTLDEAFEQLGGRAEATRTIAAIIWNKESALTESDLQGITNPNLLVYVNEARLAPSNVQNVVINGLAREIVLTDVTEGNNDWYAPQAFVAERISYTRNFTQSTTKGTSRGWESIALPFDVQTIQHESKGVIAPFNNSASNKHFWLRRLTENGLQAATNIEANTPYIISMPNSEEYTADYNLNGRVTFSAQNIDVPATTTKVLALADSSIVMVPAMQRQSRSSSVWALNVGEVRGQYFEGSVFERDYRTVRPFEAYTIHRQENGQPAPRYVPIQEIAGVTGIETIDREPLTLNQWYDMQGRKLEGKPARKGVYISNGKKVVVK